MADKINIDWSKQGCGVHQADNKTMLAIMPILAPIVDTFPDEPSNFTWDVKIHMLMPRQFPCIPNWHCDNVPRVGGVQRFDLIKPNLPMYLWLSDAPLTQFLHGYVLPQTWVRFTQVDQHRGTAASEFGWRCFIRATHREILAPKNKDNERRHCQVYLDANEYQW